MTPPKISNSHLFFLFLKIGSVAFGGFMSLIAIVESIVVKEKKWLPQETILDGISLASILPGPMAVNVITYIGYKINGIKGAIATFMGIMIPSFIMILLLGDLYLKYSEEPLVQSIFQGIMLAVAAIIIQVCLRMGRKNFRNAKDYLLALIAFLILFFAPKSIQLYFTFGIIILYGFIGYITLPSKEINNTSPSQSSSINWKQLSIPLIILASLLLLSLLPIPWQIGSLEHLFVKFSGLGLMLFGGGYVFIPLIQELVVSQYEWMSQSTFVNAIAMGQITPGPIVITIAFVGYKVNGIMGAIVSTLAIFGAPATLMLVASQLMDYFKQREDIQKAMQTIRVGVIGMIAYAAWIIINTPFTNLLSLEFVLLFKLLSLFSFLMILLLKYEANILVVIPLAGLLGALLF